MLDDNGQKLVPAVQNAMIILRLLAASGSPLGATQIAREAGLNVSSAFNILRTLSHEGLLSFDPEAKTYRIGMGLMEFAAPLLGANPADLIRPTMMAIAQEHQVAIALWQITANERVVLIDRFTAPDIVHAMISRSSRLPVFAGAIGRTYAASLGLDKTQTRKGFDSVRWQDAPDFEAYWADVLAARDSGVAQDRSNLFRGLDMVAALARDANDVPRLGMSSITIIGQQTDASLVRVGAALAEAAREIERSVFGRAVEAGSP
ncbi:Acetate operon repressor [Pseudovibrio axinellae]|uniref:Acetate operon repressor n=1 Tax=Pseudovibrio axinellae TaxID=989403 RepID=A0A165VV41_9HYPH|nr:helix-turn-helix domain-containing protein [Pseudovibrio axinellae]KZL15492.1 Acetate operon repressor [Pseudovibrio axinellae]SEQ02392.1 transcriptional regulator, IclR family [Pseudovibrio axinellae]